MRSGHLSDGKWQFAIVYLYNIAMFSRAPKEYINYD